MHKVFCPQKEVTKVPRAKKVTQKQSKGSTSTRAVLSTVSVKRSPDKISSQSILQRLQAELKIDQSYLSLVLGLLIVLVAGILVFNYFKRTSSELGPAEQTIADQQSDVTPENLPGKYTVKEGDTLFSIAQNYYKDGYQFVKLAATNKLDNPDTITAGQVLDIPKIEIASADSGTGGSTNSTIWGDKIEGDSYTVVEGDWLSTIAGRAYGDPMVFDKIAKANNISNPDLIEPGVVLKLPR